MGLGTNQITITSHDIFIPELWSRRAQKAREAALHLAQFVLRRDDEVNAMGDILDSQTISNLSASDKSANTQVTLSAPSESNVALNINKHKHVAFLIEDNIAAKSMLNLQREYTQKGAYAIGKQIDTDLFALRSLLTNSAVGTAGTALTDAVILSAWQTLSELDVPEEDRAWFFYPDAYADLLKLDKFVRTDFNTGTAMQGKGMSGLMVGWLYGSPVRLTTNVPSATTGSPATTYHRNLYLHKEAFQLGMQKQVRTQTDYILEYLGYLTVIDSIYGVGVYRADHGVEVDR